MQTNETEHHWIVRLWRFVVLVLWLGALVLVIAAWTQSGDFSELVYSLGLISIIIIITAVGIYDEFSINIFGKMRSLAPESNHRLTLHSAIGLYLVIIVTVLFASLFAMKIIEISQIIVVAIAGIELLAFLAIGYLGINRLR
jgi:hypothetical protein